MSDTTTGSDSKVEGWLAHIAAYDREFKKWQGRVEKILKKYRDESRPQGAGSTRFNILWANVQTLVPATFSRLPRPDVSRRFSDRDPVGRVAALILERALDYEIQHYGDYRTALAQVVQDRFLGGRGTAWVRYEPHIRRVEAAEGELAPAVGEDESGDSGTEASPQAGVEVTEDASSPAEALDHECVPVDYVHWKDFGHTVARTWEEVTAVWRVVYMTREALVERFGEELGGEIPLDARADELTRNQMAGEAEYSRAKVYEIWDIASRRALWLSKSLNRVLDERDDPLGLEEFWPCPRPLYATLTNDSLVPVPDFTVYQDQQATLDVLADRIDGLVRALAVKGVYDASQGAELARLFTEAENNTLLPMKSWAAFAEKNGLSGAIDLVDLAPIAAALREAYGAMEQVKGQVYELTGISDIIRGQGEASETATAQQLKGQYASLRLKAYQNEVSRFATSLLRIKAQIMCAKFDPRTLGEIAAIDQLSPEDQQLVPAALLLLRNKPLRSFRVDIEADTLVQLDEQAEQEARSAFLSAVGGYLERALPVAQASPAAGELVVGLLKFGVTGFKVGKTIEGQIDAALDRLKQMAATPPAPRPDPDMARIQAEQAAQSARVRADIQIEQARLQFDAQKLALEQQAQQAEAQRDLQLKQALQGIEAQREANQRAFDKWKAELENQTRIVVAEIQARTQVKTAAMSANAAREGEGVTELDGEGNRQPTSALSALVETINANMAQLVQQHAAANQALVAELRRPKQVVRGPDGRLVGVQ
ncbi:MAG TPA: hypothetical protein VN667_14875 [Burkholderiales bacterium]|nr:hypothetical protein [Burkholderiales bacterium]